MKQFQFPILQILIVCSVLQLARSLKTLQSLETSKDVSVGTENPLAWKAPVTMHHAFLPQKEHHRVKRGIIWNKIKKVKAGIWSAKKKVWRIKKKAVEIIVGKDYETPRPHYESTGGSWGHFRPHRPKQHVPLLSSVHGPPYGSSSTLGQNYPGKGKGWNNGRQRSSGSSTKLTYADLLAIYSLPLNKNTIRNGLRKPWNSRY